VEIQLPKSPPESIKLTYCGSCDLSVRDGVAYCQNCGSRYFNTHKYVLANHEGTPSLSFRKAPVGVK